MLTEYSAIEIAQIDGKRTHRLIEKGAHIPEIQKHVIRQILKRIDEFGDRRVTKACIAAANQPKTAQTLSEQLSARALAIFEATIDALSPEDMRSLNIYLCGVPPQFPGYLNHVLNFIGESSAEQSMKIVQARTGASIKRIDQKDHALFAVQIKKLEESKQRIIIGKLLSAQWLFEAGEGASSRMCVQQARRLANIWLGELHRAVESGP